VQRKAQDAAADAIAALGVDNIIDRSFIEL
jgi:hypothetical protein